MGPRSATIELFVQTQYPKLPRVETEPLFDKGEPLFWLTEEGWQLYRGIVERRDQLNSIASTFKPSLWRRVYLELDGLMEEKLNEDEPRTLDTLLNKGITKLTFTWGRVRFNLPIKEGKPHYKGRLNQFENFLRNQEIIGSLEGFRTGSRERWVSPDGKVYVNMTVASQLLEGLLAGVGGTLPRDITLTYMKPLDELVEEFITAGAVYIDAKQLLTKPTPRNAELYWFCLSQAYELERHYIKPVREVAKRSLLPPREKLRPETIEVPSRVGQVEAYSEFRIAKITNYRGVLVNLLGLVNGIQRELSKYKPMPYSFRTKVVRRGGTEFELEFARGVHGVYLSTPSYRLLINHVLQLKPSQGDGKRVSLYLNVNTAVPSLNSRLREFLTK
ncbi:hypothetical protein DRJ48_00795 [Candidatus Woesearchaeota archaeon]|nr:hypothetical protein [Candidatus Woesearchaeota archaeon]RLE43479.1 MAG: hypothetical protein DRJ48_00795 [Candidatus Woesearchaeota archaeon]